MEKLRPLALLLLRLGLGAIFIYHGYPKLFAHTHEFMFDAANRGGLPGYFGRLAGLVEVVGRRDADGGIVYAVRGFASDD